METLLRTVLNIADWLAAIIPQPVPSRQDLTDCKIISHRGEHDNHLIYENTLPAFRIARDNGVWGIECDIRWTADLVPVITHDSDTRRLFGKAVDINSVSFAELRQQVPQIPSLQELVSEFGGSTHLMLEIKAEPLPDAAKQKQILEELLSELSPGQDYHFLFLAPDLLSRVDFLPAKYCFLVPDTNVTALSRAALELHCGGIMGHFYLLTDALHKKHTLSGQRFGTGFITSRNCLFREINRGIEWIFSNDAVKLQSIRDQTLNQLNS